MTTLMPSAEVKMLNVRLDALEVRLNYERDSVILDELHEKVEELEAELYALTHKEPA